jgi:hypothetical protein
MTTSTQPAPTQAEGLQTWINSIEAHATQFQLAALRILRRGYDRDVSPREFKLAVGHLADALRDVRSLTSDLSALEERIGD